MASREVKKSIDKRRELVRRDSAGSEGRDIAIDARRDLTEEFESVGGKELMPDEDVNQNRMALGGAPAVGAHNAFWEKMAGALGYNIGAFTKHFSSALSAVGTKLGTRMTMETDEQAHRRHDEEAPEARDEGRRRGRDHAAEER